MKYTPESLPLLLALGRGDMMHYWQALREVNRSGMDNAVIGQLALIAHAAFDQVKFDHPDVEMTPYVCQLLDCEAE